MNAQDPPGRRPDANPSLEEQIAHLTATQREMSQQLEALRNYLIRRANAEPLQPSGLHRRVFVLEQSVQHTQATLDLILESRIWKTLQAGGALVLKMLRIGTSGARGSTEANRSAASPDREQGILIRCDTLPLEPKDPVYGNIEIRGWALAEEGVSRVEISVDGQTAKETVYGLVRQDLSAMYSEMPKADKSGFALTYDTRQLEDGVHRVTISAFTNQGKRGEIDIPLLVSQTGGSSGEYARWIEAFERSEPEMVWLKIASFQYLPTISVLVPVFRTDLAILRHTLESVIRQSYSKWELCLVDDGSNEEPLSQLLKSFQDSDVRIKVAVQASQSGISTASNRGLEMATGDYIALLDHDDVLAPDALFHVVDALQGGNPPEVVYSDEDHMDESGRRFAPFFKPDWSPDLILSENYVCHLMAFRRELAIRIGGFRSETDLSQDHDILLRLSRVANRIEHIPSVLYHWRTSLESMSRASSSEERAFESSQLAIASHVVADAPGAQVEAGLFSGRWRVRYPIPPDAHVSILIPTAGKTETLERNLDSLWQKAGATRYEIVLIDNSKAGSDQIFRYAEALRGRSKPVRYFDQRGEAFNYSRINNRAASTCSSPFLLFLNDDTEGILHGWLDALVELAARPEVGAVGAKLLYPNGEIQHAGVTMGLAEICGHSFKGARGNQRHYFDFPDLIRNVSAVTAACVMVRSQVFTEVRGFEENLFPIAYNDVDLCLRIGAAGYRILYTPHAQLYHHEALSKSDRDLHPHPAETLAFKSRWQAVIAKDPFYNPNLTRHRENWGLRWD